MRQFFLCKFRVSPFELNNDGFFYFPIRAVGKLTYLFCVNRLSFTYLSSLIFAN